MHYTLRHTNTHYTLTHTNTHLQEEEAIDVHCSARALDFLPLEFLALNFVPGFLAVVLCV
jgi:hypothetical protein